LEINEGRSLDLIEIDAASNGGIEQIRELREGIKFMPTKSKYKVFILDEAHQLSKEAANAILKTLEEPPSHAIFILATTEAHKMIPTIISRCQHFEFWKLTLPQIIDKLEYISKKEGIKIEKDALKLIAAAGGGAIRDSESLLDQVFAFASDGKEEIKASDIKDLFGIVDTDLVIKFIEFLAKKDASGALNFLNEITEKGTDLQEFLKSTINYLRQILISKINPTLVSSMVLGITKDEEQKIQNLGSQFKGIELQNILKLFLEAENKMKYSSISQLPIELAIVEITEPTNN
jgi:DNA polymerase-3 subunit gamma/tau